MGLLERMPFLSSSRSSIIMVDQKPIANERSMAVTYLYFQEIEIDNEELLREVGKASGFGSADYTSNLNDGQKWLHTFYL